jgi:hypothetical protein
MATHAENRPDLFTRAVGGQPWGCHIPAAEPLHGPALHLLRVHGLCNVDIRGVLVLERNERRGDPARGRVLFRPNRDRGIAVVATAGIVVVIRADDSFA